MTITKEYRDRALKSSFDKGDKVRRDRKNPNIWLVSSETHPNVWYRIGDGRGCSCKGFQSRGVCRHFIRASYENHRLQTANA